MRLATVALLGVAASWAQEQRIDKWELRSAADGQRLYAMIAGEDRLVSNRATAAWDGWLPQTLVYAERTTSESTLQRLRWYDAFTRTSHTIATGEALEYSLVASARLSTGDYALLISLRDREARIPYVELASHRTGVFLREAHAALGVAADDSVQILRYSPEDLEAKRGDLTLVSPTATSRVSLIAPAKVPDAAGLYEANIPAADAPGRTVTLNLRSGGQATLVTTFEGKGQPLALRGNWTQQGAEVRVTAENGQQLTWIQGSYGLTPKTWDRAQWGGRGLPLRKSQ